MSTPFFAVSQEKNLWLRQRMDELGVREEDIEERFVRSSGNGGQHLNKTSTAVQLKHLPTGLEARCSRDRSQSINRFLARRELLEKIAAGMGLTNRSDSLETKIRKQKARRSRRSSSKAGQKNIQ